MILNKLKLNAITLLIIMVARCHGEQIANSSDQIIPSYPDCNVDSAGNAKQADLRFRLPVLDTIIHNDRKMQLIQDKRRDWIFAMHGNDLQQLSITREHTNLTVIGRLDNSMWETEYLELQLISWHNYLILAVAFERHIIIYEINEEIFNKGNQTVTRKTNTALPVFEPIQDLTITGNYRRMFLTEPLEDKILLILALDDSGLNGRLRTYAWHNTFFDPVEELWMSTMNVYGLLQNYFIVGRNLKNIAETTLSTYEILPATMKLSLRQTLVVPTSHPHFINYLGKNYLLAHSKDQITSEIYKMIAGQFVAFRQVSSNKLDFNHFIAGKNFLVGTSANRVIVIPNTRVNCVSSFTTRDADVSAIMTHINERGENFILLIHERPSQTLLRIVEIEDKSGVNLSDRAVVSDEEEEAIKSNPKYKIFEQTILSLRSLLLRNNDAMVAFQKISNILSPKLKTVKVHYPVTIKAGNIGIVKITGKDLLSPRQLLKRIADMGQRFRSAQRSRRFAEAGSNQSDALKQPTRLRVQRLRVQNLLYNGNVIKGFYLDAAAKPQPILSIRPRLKTKFLNTTELLLPRRMRYSRQPSLGIFDFITPTLIMRTRQLNVSSVNSMPWLEFYNSLFLKHRDKQIKGRLVMQAAAKIETLKTSSLNGLLVENLFNLVRPQVVQTNIVLAGLSASDMSADLVNGLDFANDVAFNGRDVYIKSPVIMHELNVSGDFLFENGSRIKRSFDARDESSSVFYTGKVVINGALTLTNLVLEDAAEVFVSGTSLEPSHLKQSYLMHKTEQNFSTPLTFGNALVTTPHLSTAYLNDHPTEQHLSKSTGQANPNETLLIIFMSAEIQNDLICNAYSSQLANISREAIRHGEVANVTGHKIFEGPLLINDLMTLELNDLPVHEMILKSQLKKPLRLKGPKFFEKLQVRNETFIAEELEVNNLNSLPLRELLNYDLHLDNLTLPHMLWATNVVFHKINGISFDKIFSNIRVDKDENLVLHKNLIVEGNAKFSENLSVDLINNVKWAEYQESLVRMHENAVIGGHKRFQSELVITKSLKTATLNDYNIEEIFSNVLSRSKPQLITGSYSFDVLEVGNMDVSVINDIPTASFIDMSSQEVTIEGDIVVPRISVRGNIQGELRSPLNFSSIDHRLQELPQKPWTNINVLGNVHWNASRSSDNNHNLHKLAYLRQYGVTRTGNNIISGNVRLRRPTIAEMNTRTAFPKDIDFDFIAKDCLLKEAPYEQIVMAAKNFRKPLNMLSVEVEAVLGCNKINNIDVLRLNASLYRVSSGEPLLGPLHFLKPPIVGHIAVRGTTNGLNSAKIYHDPKQLVPPIQIAELHIDSSLQLNDINEMSLDYLLRNRVTKQGPALEIFGFLTFENLVLNKEILLQSINGIAIDSLILKTSNSLQALTGAKTIEGDLILAGPAHVLRLNNIELVDNYQKGIFKHLSYHFDNLAVDEATFEAGLLPQQEQFMRAAPLDERQSKMATKFEQRKRLKAIERELAAIDNIINDAEMEANKTQHLIYLDYDLEAQIVWQSANETIDKSLTYERQRLSLCERQNIQVQMTASRKRIFLKNVTSSVLNGSHHGWNVQLENFCSRSTGKVRSKATLNTANFKQSFKLRTFIENVYIFQPTANETGLILHAVDLAGKHNEVRWLKVTANDVEDLQSLTDGIGKVLKLFQLSLNYSLLISSALIENYPALSIYACSANRTHFELLQVIDGDYDIIELLQIDSKRYHLILSCVQCQRISVFEYNIDASSHHYRIYQFIKLNQLIDKLVPFTTGDGSHYILVLSEHGQDYYHLYKFSHVQGWQHFTYGYFNDIQLAVPLVTPGSQLVADDNSLLILCNSHGKCDLVRAFMQF